MKYICIQKFHPYWHKLELGKIYIIKDVGYLPTIEGVGMVYNKQVNDNFIKLSEYRENRINEILYGL